MTAVSRTFRSCSPASGPVPRTVLELIQSGRDGWRRTAERLAAKVSGKSFAGGLSPTDVRWHAPIPRPLKNIVCLGLNYASHVRETTRLDKPMKVPEIPVFFTKAPTSASGPYDPIPWVTIRNRPGRLRGGTRRHRRRRRQEHQARRGTRARIRLYGRQ